MYNEFILVLCNTVSWCLGMDQKVILPVYRARTHDLPLEIVSFSLTLVDVLAYFSKRLPRYLCLMLVLCNTVSWCLGMDQQVILPV